MPAYGRFRPPLPYLVVFDGQSLVLYQNGNMPAQLMALHPGIRWVVVGVGGTPWGAQAFSGSLHYSQTSRLLPWATRAKTTILVMVGGTADLNGTLSPFQLAATGLTTLAREQTYADAARAAGFDYIINTTTTPASYIFGSKETERGNLRTALLSEPLYPAVNGHFDAVVDLAGNPALQNVNDVTYYQDQSGTKVHWTEAGGLEAATDPIYGIDTALSLVLP